MAEAQERGLTEGQSKWKQYRWREQGLQPWT